MKVPKAIQSTVSIGSRNGLSNNQWIAIITVIVITSSLIGVLNIVKTPLLFVFEPFYYYGNQVGSNVRDTFSFLGEIGDLKSENENLTQENILLISENALYLNLKQENIALQKELELGDISVEKVEASVTSFDPSGYLLLNVGSKEKIKEGDVVSLGNTYIGRVVQVSYGVSKVRTALSSDSILQIEITRKVSIEDNVEELGSTFDRIQKEIVHSVIKGTALGIIAEDIKLGEDVKEGDYAIVNDEKVGAFLVVGQLEDITDDPTQPDLSAYVKPIVNYEELTYVFVNTK
jgi:rod shape-determining protein MreC